jgi:hypothetical protein
VGISSGEGASMEGTWDVIHPIRSVLYLVSV